jgi:signal transduction histidine kinase
MMDNSIHSSTPVSLTEDECLTGPPPNNEDASSSGKNEEDLPDESLKSQSTPVAFDSEDGGGHSTLEHPNIPSNEHQLPSSSNTDLKGTSLKSTLYADDFIAEVDKHYNRVACSALCVWLTLVSISFYIGKRKNALETLTGIEQKAPLVASLLLGMSLVSSLLPLLVRKKKRCLSGVVVCAVVVQLIAFSTDLLLAFFPTPVLIDPVCGTKSYLLRYCEWTPLAFTMAFLTESCRIDDPSKRAARGGNNAGTLSMIISAMSMTKAPSQKFDQLDGSDTEEDLKGRVQKRLNSAYYLGLTQGLSTFCGWIFPLCPGPISWIICMIVSCALFSVLWSRFFLRTKSFKAMESGSTLSEQEMYNWTRLSLGLLRTCTYVWSMLVAVFFVCAIGPNIFPNNNILKIPGLSMMLESTLDVVFKAIYLLIVIDVHDTIFDPSARAERRLEELRQMLSVVWDNSSDVIGISVQGVSGDVTTMLSPTYMKIFAGINNEEEDPPKSSKHGMALAFELNSSCFNSDVNAIPTNVYDLDMQNLSESKPYIWTKSNTLKKKELESMAKLVVKAWKTDSRREKTLLMHDLTRARGSVGENIRCEANITRMEENALVIVVRDISERFRRFEAEKKVISETTARLKDAAANRFTRHEVKNGLLSAIALCDSLQESVNDLSARVKSLDRQVVEKNTALSALSELEESVNQTNATSSEDRTTEVFKTGPGMDTSTHGDSSTQRFLFELDKTLYEILDTILAEAMARDVIHEIYEPNLERVNVPQVLSESININANILSNKRFPINTKPVPLPDFGLDTQLLKYIHRNAISNACKYGQKGGVVVTDVYWDKENRELSMDVTNLPGENHSEILKLGELAEEVVFSPRRRLTMHSTGDDNNKVSASHSSGDGAWIMLKCAKTLGGKCNIQVSFPC